jgi:hypothetical protein
MADDSRQPERPRVEPEIIPPDHSGERSDWDRPAWRYRDAPWTGTTQRIYVGRIGPSGFVLMLALVGLVAVLFLAIIGTALLWLPFVLLAAGVAAFYRLWRR